MWRHLTITYRLQPRSVLKVLRVLKMILHVSKYKPLDDNCKTFNVVQFDINDVRQGIAHVVGPEQGLTLPGMTVVCGDSAYCDTWCIWLWRTVLVHRKLNMYLATQCLVQKKMKNMLVRVDGKLVVRRNTERCGFSHHRENRHCGRHRSRN